MTSAPPLDPPFRAISRLSTEMHVSGMMLVDAALPNDLDRSIVVLVLMRVCAPDWTAGGTLHRPARLTRFISTYAIATSLGRSPETIRRHVSALLATSVCIRTPAGLALNPDPAGPIDLLGLYASYHDLLIGFVEDIGALTPLPPPPRAPEGSLLETIVGAALDIALIPVEQFGHLFSDWTAMRVWIFIGALNVRHVTLDPFLSQRYAIDSTPDAIRRPVPARFIARVFSVPYATVWRHCHALEAAGLLSQTPGGWLVRTAQLRDAPIEASVVAAITYYLRRISTLIGQGFDAADTANAYVAGRIPLASVGYVPDRDEQADGSTLSSAPNDMIPRHA